MLTKDADGDCRCERVPTPNQLGTEGAPGDGKALRDTTFSSPPFFGGGVGDRSCRAPILELESKPKAALFLRVETVRGRKTTHAELLVSNSK